MNKEKYHPNRKYYCDFDYFENGIITTLGIQPIVKMEWVNAENIKTYIKNNLNSPVKLIDLSKEFLEMVKTLHLNNISHGDLQHGNILIKNDDKIILVDYDSMYLPGLKGYNDDIKGLFGYQHESRIDNKFLSHKSDYFSELVIYLSLLVFAEKPNLWNFLNCENTETLLFSRKDIQSNGKSAIFSTLLKMSPIIINLTNIFIDYCKKPSIEDLFPLEEVVKSPIDIDTISSKWKKQTYVKPKCEIEVNNISKKWN